MKNLPFRKRARFAWAGVRLAWRKEASFRTQALAGLAALALLLAIRPRPIWWAVFLLTIGAVLAAELFNTALENLADCLHPDENPLIMAAKDCAAGAVLILSAVSLGVLGALLIDKFS
jgi:diacylglycerol kinase (ATP)